jgi:hypothetical protein
MNKRFSLLILTCLLIFSGLQSQNVIQFSGIVVTGDSLNSVPYTNIIVENTNRGTTSDFFGYFSFVAQESDTIVFSAVGFRQSRFIIPDSMADNRYSLIQVLFKDTVELGEVVIYPWPSKEAFKEAFLNARPADDDYQRAANNLEPSKMLVMMETMSNDGYSNYKTGMEQYYSQLYYSGQAPPMNLFNPIAWASFIDALKTGKLKDPKKQDVSGY